MSLSNPRQVNPAKKFIDWSGSKGKFKYFDKTRGEKGEDVYFDNSIYIIPLDKLNTIRGYHDQSKSGIFSNEVKNLSKEKLIVRSFKGGIIASGLYAEIKGKLEGGKFSNSIYAAMITVSKDDVTLELVNLQFYGSAIGSLIDARVNVDSGEVISLSPSTEKLTKGNTEYFAPVIKKHGKREDILAKCIEMDRELQNYLKTYFEKPVEEEDAELNADVKSEAVSITNEPEPIGEDDLPF